MKEPQRIGDIAKQILKEIEINSKKQYTNGHYYKCSGLPGLVELVKIEGDSAQVRFRGNIIKVSLCKLQNI